MLVEEYIYTMVIIIYCFKLITRYIIIHDILALSEFNFVIRFEKNYYYYYYYKISLVYVPFFSFSSLKLSFEKEKTASTLNFVRE